MSTGGFEQSEWTLSNITILSCMSRLCNYKLAPDVRGSHATNLCIIAKHSIICCRCRDVQLQNRRRILQHQEEHFVEGELVVHLSSDNNTEEGEEGEGERQSRLRSPPPALEQSQG